MKKIKVSIIGGSGYAGGELLRLLLFHPNVEIAQVTSEKFSGKLISKVHPNLRKITALKFSSINDLHESEVFFLCLPHKESMKKIKFFKSKAKKIIDLSADFRLNSAELYKKWYKEEHASPDLLDKFIYGIPELHREKMKNADFVSSAGCNATAVILALYPLYKEGIVEKTIVEVKVGSSEAGNTVSDSSHHPIRTNCVRSFMPTHHRHTAEIIQELSLNGEAEIHFSATAIDLVRGILATSHVFLKENIDEKKIWQIYRDAYKDEPFIRIVKEQDGLYRYPEPKILFGTNYCDIGFEKDPDSNRLVVISAIDNLMKGASGQAVQAFNIMHGFDEKTSLEFPGLHPI